MTTEPTDTPTTHLVKGGHLSRDNRKQIIRINGILLPLPLTVPQALLGVATIAIALGTGLFLAR